MNNKRPVGRPKGSGHGYVPFMTNLHPESVEWMNRRVVATQKAWFVRTAVAEKIARETGKGFVKKVIPSSKLDN